MGLILNTEPALILTPMKLPYLTVDFSLSPAAWQWAQDAIEPVIEDFQATAPIEGALLSLSREQQDLWYNSQVWQEITDFTDQAGLPRGDLQFFAYKSRPPKPDPRGNPHIDTTGPSVHEGDRIDVTARFNILLRGDTNQRMSWWNRDRNDPAIVVSLFQRKDGAMVRRLQARGDNKTQQYHNIGPAEWTCDSLAQLNARASFVRTDILHALDWTAHSPRFVLSVRFLEPWSTIERYRDRLSGRV